MFRRVNVKYECVSLQSDIPLSSANFTLYTPGLGTLSYRNTIIPSWEKLGHFRQLMPFINIHFSFHQVPITAGWTEVQHNIRSLPNTSTHSQQCNSSTGHPSKYKLGSALLNFSDLTGSGYSTAMCYQSSVKGQYWLQFCILCMHTDYVVTNSC